jgi:hypothetical protein
MADTVQLVDSFTGSAGDIAGHVPDTGSLTGYPFEWTMDANPGGLSLLGDGTVTTNAGADNNQEGDLFFDCGDVSTTGAYIEWDMSFGALPTSGTTKTLNIAFSLWNVDFSASTFVGLTIQLVSGDDVGSSTPGMFGVSGTTGGASTTMALTGTLTNLRLEMSIVDETLKFFADGVELDTFGADFTPPAEDWVYGKIQVYYPADNRSQTSRFRLTRLEAGILGEGPPPPAGVFWQNFAFATETP